MVNKSTEGELKQTGEVMGEHAVTPALTTTGARSLQEDESHPVHILIVDDDKPFGEMLENVITSCTGFDCSFVTGAREALTVLEEKVVDVVITDIRMPDMDGLELTKIIKERYDADVIAVTGYYEDFSYEDAINYGANDFIAKPVKPTELLIRLRRVLRERAISYKRKQAEERIHASLREKEILLMEVHHRVKNNMQVISGLLDLQARTSGNPELSEMLRESQSRIRSMSLVHEKLYGSKDFARIDMADYVRTLSQELSQLYKINPGKIDLTIQTDGAVYVDINKAIPCGLIMNELISNALKHAFPSDGPGELRIIMRETKSTEIEIVVRDNGFGLPGDVDIHQPRTAGLHLVNGLVKNQLDGQIEVRRDAGTEFRIKFPL